MRNSIAGTKVASPEKIDDPRHPIVHNPRRPSMMNCLTNNLGQYANLVGNGLNTASKMTINVLRFRNGTPSFEEAKISTNERTISLSLPD